MNLTETLREPEGKTLEFKRAGHMTPACAAGGRWSTDRVWDSSSTATLSHKRRRATGRLDEAAVLSARHWNCWTSGPMAIYA